ncbi:MAG: prephenate dehydrogenase/arogenate dehydrogenase family protein [Dehalococcoidia bacterium]|nr:prephenate dehydrogenase/arogenate dehydrogenase family protein [Dehalococcoidia bacterium]
MPRRIAIVGLGLIGGSLGLALKRANLPDLEVAGVARSRGTVQKARRLQAIDIDCADAAEAVSGAQLIVVASPIMTIRGVFAEIAPALAEGAVITDVASTKRDVARWAQEFLPMGVHYVGGHPMAGKETQGIDEAEASLFEGKPWVISPSVTADEASVQTIVGLAQLAGARPVFMDAEEHDSYVAAISHLPLVVSSALFSTAFGSAAWPELAALASSGFRDTTRLASGSPEMAHDIIATNRANLLHWLDRFQDELMRFRDVIGSAEGERVIEAFARGQLERDNYMTNGPPQRDVGEPMERISFADMLLGSKIAGMMRKQEEAIRAAEARVDEKKR